MSFSNQKRYLNARWLLEFRKLMGLAFKRNGVIRMPFYLDGEPLLDPHTQEPYYRLRFTRKGAEPKVLGPKDTTVHWYFPPLTKELKRSYKSWRHILQTPSISIRFAEDGLKAAAVMYHTGEPCIGLCGINTGLAAPELSLLKCKGREIELLPDSRATTGVKRGTLALGDEFASHGGIVKLGMLPTLAGQKSTGPDDFLARYREEGVKDLRAPTANRRLVQCHAWNSDVVKDWRTSAGIPDDSLPEILRNLEPMPITWMDESPEPIEFGVEGLIAKHEIAAVAAIGGTGKTSVFIRVGMGIALGQDALGLRIKKARSVMYCMLERHGRNFRRRVHRATQQLMREAADESEAVQEIRRLLTTNWYPVPLAGEHLGLVKKEHGEWAMNTPLIDELARVSKERGIEMIFVDTISRLHGGSGIDDALAITVVRALERLIMATGCGVVFLGHVGKKERQDQYALFGSSVWVDATSGLITLEAEKPELVRKATILRVELPNAKIDPAQDIVIRLDHRRTSDFAPHPIKHFVIYRQKGSEGEIAACEFGISAQDNMKFVVWAVRKYHAENGSFTKHAFWTARLAGDVGLKLHHQIFLRLIADKELVRDPQSKKTDLYMPADTAQSAFAEEEPDGGSSNYGNNSSVKPARRKRRGRPKSAKRGNGLGEESGEKLVTTPR